MPAPNEAEDEADVAGVDETTPRRKRKGRKERMEDAQEDAQEDAESVGEAYSDSESVETEEPSKPRAEYFTDEAVENMAFRKKERDEGRQDNAEA